MQNGSALLHQKTDDKIEILLGSKPHKQIQYEHLKELKIQGAVVDLPNIDYL